MDESLDQIIRNNNVPNLDMSLDEYIHLKNIGKPPVRSGNANNRGNNETDSKSTGLSKFERYRHQDDDDDDEMDEDVPKEMPKLKPFEIKTLPPKNPTKPIHQRLGERGSICESIHTSQMKLFQPNSKAKQRISVQNRLGKSWVNPAARERTRIALHTLKSIVDNPRNNPLVEIDGDGLQLLNAFATAVKNGKVARAIDGAADAGDGKQKYNMAIQKEISMVQGKRLTYTCPGGLVVSSDGPGIGTKVPQHHTNMSLNQRFA